MSGVDLPTVKKLMGHSDIQTTMIYAHLAPDHLADAVNKLLFYPRQPAFSLLLSLGGTKGKRNAT
jgi:site-specific recombinase XerD